MTLAEAGVASAPVDALHLAAHLLGQEVSDVRRLMVRGGVEAPEGYDELVAERATRVPLQHLTGRAWFRRLELRVGPGVFVPRPESELVVDLAHGWAVANRDRLGLEVTLEQGDACTAYPQLVGEVDVVTCNPPYIPLGQVPVDPEVRDHDPEVALYGGSPDGLATPLAMAVRAAQLLRPGGCLVVEHADTQGRSLSAALLRTGCWTSLVDHADLAGKPRCLVAVRG